MRNFHFCCSRLLCLTKTGKKKKRNLVDPGTHFNRVNSKFKGIHNRFQVQKNEEHVPSCRFRVSSGIRKESGTCSRLVSTTISSGWSMLKQEDRVSHRLCPRT